VSKSIASGGGSPRRAVAAEATACFAVPLATEPDVDIGAPLFASPTTWTPGAPLRASKLRGSACTQPDRSASPESIAIRAADCGGTAFATSTLWRVWKVGRRDLGGGLGS
jgi:hypothetical protein